MKDWLPFLLFVAVVVAMWFSSCVTPAPSPVHSIQTITTICPGPLCAICADESTKDSQ